jgi:hypothetical protein
MSVGTWSSVLSPQQREANARAFIDDFNRTMAEPYQWTYQGKPLAV